MPFFCCNEGFFKRVKSLQKGISSIIGREKNIFSTNYTD